MTIKEAIEKCERFAASSYTKGQQDYKQFATWLRELDRLQWVPIEERLPDTNADGVSDYVMVSFDNYPMTDIGRYETDPDGGGAFYHGDSIESYSSIGLFVNAWMPALEPYKEPES